MALIALSGVANKFCRKDGKPTLPKEKSKADESDEEKEEVLVQLPCLQEGDNLQLERGAITQHKTKPKPLFTEATLLFPMRATLYLWATTGVDNLNPSRRTNSTMFVLAWIKARSA